MDNKFKPTNLGKIKDIARKTTKVRQDAMAYIWNAYSEPIRNCVKNELNRRGMYQEAKNNVDDITSDIMKKIFQRGIDGKLKINLIREDGTKALFRNYIKSLVKFTVLDKFDEKINDPHVPIETNDNKDEDNNNNKEILPPVEANVEPNDDDLNRAFIEALCNSVNAGETDRDILFRVKLKGESPVDIAAEYGYDRSWVDVRISRLMTVIKKEIKKDPDIKTIYVSILSGRENEMSLEQKNSSLYKFLAEFKENI